LCISWTKKKTGEHQNARYNCERNGQYVVLMDKNLQFGVCCQFLIAEATYKSVKLHKVLALIFCIREFLGSVPETDEPGRGFV